MTSSGPTNIPPGGGAADRSLLQSAIDLKAKVIELCGALAVQRVREKLEGEIVRNNPDGTTVIKTDKGEITVDLRGREPPPPGTKVEVEVPPGSPPRQVIVRPAPEQQEARPVPEQAQAPSRPQPQQQQQQTTPDTAARPQSGSPSAPPRLDVRTAEDLAKALASLPLGEQLPVTLKPQDIIRLLSLPPTQQQGLSPAPAAQTIPAQVTGLPDQPRVALPDALFATASPALRITPAEPQLILHDLPSQLPVLSLATQDPFSAYAADPAARPSFSAAQNLIRQILFANVGAAPDFAPGTPPPILIAPASAATVPQNLPGATVLDQSPLKQFLAQAIALPSAPAANSPVLSTAAQPAPVIANNGGPAAPLLDVRVNTIFPPAITFTPDGAQADAPVAKGAPHAPHIPGAALLPEGFAGNLSGTVAGFTQQNLPILTVSFPTGQPAQNFILQFPTVNLAQGMRLEMTPLPTAPAASQSPLAPFIPFEFFSDFSWPAMDDLSRTLQQAAPQLAQVLSNVTASAAAPARMPMAALFFIAAMRSGDVGGWLGARTVDTLRRIGKGDLLGRLARDAGGLQRSESQPPGEWRATAMPMMWDGQMHKMMLYYRHDEKDGAEGEEKKRGTRFIFDLNLSKLGEVQLDGLHRKGRLDLIVRTTERLSPPMQQAMRRRYVEVMDQTELAGELSFQNKAEQFVRVPMPKKAQST